MLDLAHKTSSRTLEDVLNMLDAPIVMSDADIAEALGSSVLAVRTRLEELAEQRILRPPTSRRRAGMARDELNRPTPFEVWR